ncbi:MAG: hypothetical protein KAX27_00745 [Candidatus Aminicenantes bacterium]|nr:hypothetical protein [Candidatus Aminicenantes bacterium]
MSGTSIRKQALKEIAREKSWSYGKKSTSLGSFQEIPSEQEAKENEAEIEELPSKEGISMIPSPTEEIPSEESSMSQFKAHRIPSPSAFTWQQYRPWGETKKKKKPRSVNTATIWCAARKIISQEWRKARGVKKRDHRFDQLEQEAAVWKKKREEERRSQLQAKLKLERYKKYLEKSLPLIGDKITEEKNNITLEKANKLVENAFEDLGKIYNLEWKDTALDIWIEPWEEKRTRQKRGEAPPVIIYFRINNQLEIDFIKLIEDEEVVVQKKRMMERELESSIDKEEISLMSDEEIGQLLEKKLCEMGRVIELRKLQDNRWTAFVEPWEEIRERNIKGKGPVTRTQIEVNCSEGKFNFVPQAMR